LWLVAASRSDASFPGANGWIAYESSSTGLEIDRDIWATEQTTEGVLTTVRLTNDILTPRRDLFPAVSRNGREIVFSRRHPTEADDTELWTMEARDADGDGFGDAVAPLTDNAVRDDNPAWSPNGKKLAYASSPPEAPVPQPSDIYVMKRCDPLKAPRTLPRDPNTFSNQHPVFSPDGEWIAWAGVYTGAAPDVDLLITQSDGSGPVIKLTDTAGPVGETHPEFSPDGTKLAFSSNRDKTGDGVLDDQDIYVMRVFARDADGNLVLTPETADNVPVSITDEMIDGVTKTNERWPAWSPVGASIAVWSGLGAANSPSQHPGIWVIAADGTGKPLRITDPLVNPAPLRPDWALRPPRTRTPASSRHRSGSLRPQAQRNMLAQPRKSRVSK
jgi:Tol biopolymer transport system component